MARKRSYIVPLYVHVSRPPAVIPRHKHPQCSRIGPFYCTASGFLSPHSHSLSLHSFEWADPEDTITSAPQRKPSDTLLIYTDRPTSTESNTPHCHLMSCTPCLGFILSGKNAEHILKHLSCVIENRVQVGTSSIVTYLTFRLDTQFFSPSLLLVN